MTNSDLRDQSLPIIEISQNHTEPFFKGPFTTGCEIDFPKPRYAS
ncbi:hypothetical protein SRDD_15080 [Serratia sp. DD3]|nr:hypothetical protein SRDD_15080 [Serratia sp. DD3]